MSDITEVSSFPFSALRLPMWWIWINKSTHRDEWREHINTLKSDDNDPTMRKISKICLLYFANCEDTFNFFDTRSHSLYIFLLSLFLSLFFDKQPSFEMISLQFVIVITVEWPIQRISIRSLTTKTIKINASFAWIARRNANFLLVRVWAFVQF